MRDPADPLLRIEGMNLACGGDSLAELTQKSCGSHVSHIEVTCLRPDTSVGYSLIAYTGDLSRSGVE